MSYIPTLPVDTPIETQAKGLEMVEFEWTSAYLNWFQALLQSLQKTISDEGFLIPSQNNENMAKLEASDSILPGTLIFNTQAVNGGTSDNPRGQLYVKLQDGLFHPVTNT